MIENKKYSVNELVQYKYSDIGEYIDENHTPKPLRNDELVKILNNYECWIKELEKENLELLNINASLRATNDELSS
jgi:hypothetical protein